MAANSTPEANWTSCEPRTWPPMNTAATTSVTISGWVRRQISGRAMARAHAYCSAAVGRKWNTNSPTLRTIATLRTAAAAVARPIHRSIRRWRAVGPGRSHMPAKLPGLVVLVGVGVAELEDAAVGGGQLVLERDDAAGCGQRHALVEQLAGAGGELELVAGVAAVAAARAL